MIIAKQPGKNRNPQPEPPQIDAPIPGVEILEGLRTVIVQQKVELVEAVLDFKTKNQYSILTDAGVQLFRAYEKPVCCAKMCFTRRHGFSMHIVDNYKRTVMKVNRPCVLCVCCCCTALISCIPCFSDKVKIEAPPGRKIGAVYHKCGCKLNFNVYDDKGHRFAYITGPSYCRSGCCTCRFYQKIFEIYSSIDNSKIGAITKLWGGLFKDLFTDADVFEVEFPPDMAASAKAILIGAVFLIDFIAFEGIEPVKKI